MKRLTLAFAFLIFLAAGCGQSGPLYIPGNPSKVSMPPPPPEAAAEKAEESADKDGEADNH